ncbi:unnamed protein product [Vicia faba]|uniref:C2H2-type domain-containing protein n=1 Tax=Vicia faba TaxID=3906 RepID=A0AAV0YKY1_VICFA|nr:unnamed protein product [Vicia faba]
MEGFHSDEYWFWMKRRQIQAQTESWEEKAFAEDAARSILNGSIWPPRFYSCNFCKREFRSAQALGGHMNIHRRDRARLKQNLSPQNNNDFINSSSLGNHCFPAKRGSISPPRMISTLSSPYSSSIIWGQKKIGSNITREDSFKDCVETSLSLGMFGQKSSTVVLPCEEKGIMCKRLKTNNNTSSLPSVFIKPCSNDHHQRFLTFQQPSEIVLGVNHGMEDLDLELRLGKQQKAIK